jgi:hypothetical protein
MQQPTCQRQSVAPAWLSRPYRQICRRPAQQQRYAWGLHVGAMHPCLTCCHSNKAEMPQLRWGAYILGAWLGLSSDLTPGMAMPIVQTEQCCCCQAFLSDSVPGQQMVCSSHCCQPSQQHVLCSPGWKLPCGVPLPVGATHPLAVERRIMHKRCSQAQNTWPALSRRASATYVAQRRCTTEVTCRG